MSGIIGGAGSKSGVIGITELDYEEGTFTATLTSETPPSTPPTATGEYTKIGKVCHFNIYRFDNANTSGGSGQMLVTGLPFTAFEATAVVAPLSEGFDFNTSYRQLWTLAATTLSAMESRSGTTWYQWNITAGTAKYLVVSGSYRTA